jgi:uncharacterized metal-binding protein YceD (DUF177 family)
LPANFCGVETNQDFNIPFKGLSSGNYRYVFEINDTFFESFEYFETNKGRLTVILDLLKETGLMDLHFDIKGFLQLACDRCLKEFNQPVEGKFRLIIKFGEEYVEETEEVMVIPHEESRIDVSQFIFEYINLLLPLQHAHADSKDCDQKVIEKLEKYSKPKTDPRWEALKNIKLK